MTDAPAIHHAIGDEGGRKLSGGTRTYLYASMVIVAAIVVSGLIGLLLGRAVMRLVGPYLALTTLSFAEIMRLVIANSIDITRGDLGLNVAGLMDSRVGWYYLFLGALVVLLILFYMLLRSKAGLFLQAIRDDEVAARRAGVNVVFWKTAAFAISARRMATMPILIKCPA